MPLAGGGGGELLCWDCGESGVGNTGYCFGGVRKCLCCRHRCVRLKLTTSDPLMKAAMVDLAEAQPLPVKFGELSNAGAWAIASGRARRRRSREQLAARLLNGYASGLIEFGLTAPAFVGHVSERPVPSGYARLRGRTAEKVSNLRLESIGLTEASRLVLGHLDGTHDRAALIGLVEKWLEKQAGGEQTETARERAVRYVENILPVFAAECALLVG